MALIGKKTNTREVENSRDELVGILSSGKAMDPSGVAASQGHEHRRMNMFMLGNMLEFRDELRSVENESVDAIMWSHHVRLVNRMNLDAWEEIALWGTNFIGDRRKLIDIAETVMIDNMEYLRDVIEANRHVPAGGSDQEEARHRKMALMDIDEKIKRVRKSTATARAAADAFKRAVESIDALRLNANEPWKGKVGQERVSRVWEIFIRGMEQQPGDKGPVERIRDLEDEMRIMQAGKAAGDEFGPEARKAFASAVVNCAQVLAKAADLSLDSNVGYGARQALKSLSERVNVIRGESRDKDQDCGPDAG